MFFCLCYLNLGVLVALFGFFPVLSLRHSLDHADRTIRVTAGSSPRFPAFEPSKCPSAFSPSTNTIYWSSNRCPEPYNSNVFRRFRRWELGTPRKRFAKLNLKGVPVSASASASPAGVLVPVSAPCVGFEWDFGCQCALTWILLNAFWAFHSVMLVAFGCSICRGLTELVGGNLGYGKTCC